MSKKKTYPNLSQIYGFLGNNTYGFYDTETEEKIKVQEIFKELLKQRLNQNKDENKYDKFLWGFATASILWIASLYYILFSLI